MEIKFIDNKDELTEAMELLGLSTKQLADVFELSPQAVMKWYKGQTKRVPCYVGRWLYEAHGIHKNLEEN